MSARMTSFSLETSHCIVQWNGGVFARARSPCVVGYTTCTCALQDIAEGDLLKDAQQV